MDIIATLTIRMHAGMHTHLFLGRFLFYNFFFFWSLTTPPPVGMSGPKLYDLFLVLVADQIHLRMGSEREFVEQNSVWHL